MSFRWFKLGTNTHTGSQDWLYTGGYFSRNYQNLPEIYWQPAWLASARADHPRWAWTTSARLPSFKNDDASGAALLQLTTSHSPPPLRFLFLLFISKATPPIPGQQIFPQIQQCSVHCSCSFFTSPHLDSNTLKQLVGFTKKDQLEEHIWNSKITAFTDTCTQRECPFEWGWIKCCIGLVV